MKHVALLTLAGFLGMIFLGFMPMTHGSHHDAAHENERPCPIASLLQVICASDSASMALVHLSTLQSLINTPIPAAFIFLSLFISIAVLYEPFRNTILLSGARVWFYWKQVEKHNFLFFNRKIQSWLSLFEHSPSFI
jgi:hypothetical protein